MSGQQKTPEEMHETRVEAGKSKLGTAGGSGGEGRAREGFEKKRKERGRAQRHRVFFFFFFKLTFFTNLSKNHRGRRHQGGEVRRTPWYVSGKGAGER